MIRLRPLIVAALLGTLSTLGLAEEPAPVPATRPKVVLVLSGGGARGIAHIGVLEELDELHVPVDMVVGTSMGSIVGGLFATGRSPQEIEDFVLGLDWNSVFFDRLPRELRTYRRKQDDSYLVPIKMRFKNWKPYLPPSVIGGQGLELTLRALEIEATGETDFDRFPIPYRAIAADLSTGTAVVLDHGSLATAMKASMSVPGIFPPVELGGRPLCDGGVAANLPIRIARSLGATTIIGVDITSPLRGKESLGNLLQRIDQVTSLLTNNNRVEDLKALQPQDVLLTPDLGDMTFSDFTRVRQAIDAGKAAAKEAAGRLSLLAVSDEAWAAYVARRRLRSPADLVVDEVRVRNTSLVDTKVVTKGLDVPRGQPLDEPSLSKQILKLYALDTFGTIHHELAHEDGKGVLTIDTPKKPYGRNSLQFGFNFEDDFSGDIVFNVSASHLMNPVNRLGGEWRNAIQIGDDSVLGTDFYQPLGAGDPEFVEASLGVRNDKYTAYDDGGSATAQYRVRSGSGRLGVGSNFGVWGQLQGGAFRLKSDAKPYIGATQISGEPVNDGGAFLSFRVDSLDSFTWPRNGIRADAEYRRSIESMGADFSGDFVRGSFAMAGTLGKNVLFGSVEASTNRTGGQEVASQYFLGGFARISGLNTNELVGDEGGLARLLYYRELKTFSLGSMTQRMFAGMSLEAGQVYQRSDAITWSSLRPAASVFAGADTILGPAYVAVGMTEGRRVAVYLIIGQHF